MYLPLVMFGYGGILCLALAGCWLVSSAVRGLRGMQGLTWAVAAAIVSVVLVGLRPWVPAFVTVLLGNCALFAYFLLIYWATARILGVPARALPWLISICAAVLLPFSFYAFIHPNIVARIVLGGGTAALIAVITAAMLFRNALPSLQPAAATLGWVQIFSALVYTARSAASVLWPPVHFVRGDWLQTSFTYGQMLARVGTCCGVLWLAVCVHNAELEEKAKTDSLTGLLNRRAFDELLELEMQRCRRTGRSVGLVLVDIDLFKRVNDTYGHSEGDAVIRQTAETLRKGIRPGDILARYGGEEFAILFPEVEPERMLAIAERLRATMEECAVGPMNIRVTVSLGLAESRASDSALDLLNRCDRALYQAKTDGRNRLSAEGA